LDEIIAQRYQREDGLILRIQTTFVDSGYATQEVYKYTYPRQARRVFATKGKATPGKQLIFLSKQKFRRGLKLYIVATDGAKDKVFSHLQVKAAGPGYWHMPDHYPEDWFDALTAEQKFTKMVRGVATQYYRKIRTRKEALDCRVLALAALEKVSPNWEVLERNLSRRAKKEDGEKIEKPEKLEKPPPRAAASRRRARRAPRRGFIYDY
jgi:phage terminase large subunit GpA-like protein